jgi:hypothetical protein
MTDTQTDSRLRALALANSERSARAALTRELHGQLALADALADPRAARMPIYELLTRAPRVGRQRALKLLRKAQIPEHRRVGELTPRMRATLHDQLR